jgi:hypothetical protein
MYCALDHLSEEDRLGLKPKTYVNFCNQVSAWVPNTFGNIYLAKNKKSATNLTTTKLEKKSAYIWNS